MMTLVLSMFLMFAQQPALQLAPQPPVLVVGGNADILAVPDQAVVSLGILRQDSAAQAAQAGANGYAQAIIAAIVKLGVPANQIQTARLVLTPVYAEGNQNPRNPPRIVSYNATNTISVRLDNLSLVGLVIDAGLEAGANQLGGVQFGLRNDLPAREQALQQAVLEARTKAQVMADALRVNLMEVLEVSEGGVSVVPRSEFAPSARLMTAAADVATPVSPGQLEVRANVTIRYRISPKP
jgi:uncharacterized protein YggE